MANRYVRIYNGPEQSNIIGFSMSARPESESFNEFMSERGYEVEPYDWLGEETNPRHREAINKIGGVSLHYFGIEPPLSDEHTQEFAVWCSDTISTGYNKGFLIDNRNTPAPIEPYSKSHDNIIAHWDIMSREGGYID